MNNRHLFPLTEEENVALLYAAVEKRFYVDLAFGTGGAALIWRKGEPMPEAVKHLAHLRGVLVENMDGAGI